MFVSMESSLIVCVICCYLFFLVGFLEKIINWHRSFNGLEKCATTFQLIGNTCSLHLEIIFLNNVIIEFDSITDATYVLVVHPIRL